MYKPRFEIIPEINNRIAEIERIREVVGKSQILPEQEVVLRLRAKVEAVHSSISIEGNRLNKREVEKVLAGELVRANERMITEALNYKRAIDWMERRLGGAKKVGLKDILQLHALVMSGLLPKGKVGAYRPGPVYIVDVVGKREIVRYVGPKRDRIEALMENLLAWLNEDGGKLHPVLVAGILHYELVSIHPFSDGNGRVTRLVTMLYLWLNQYDFRRVLVLDGYYWQHRPEYYRALDRAKTYDDREGADITPWLGFFTKGFLEAVKDLEAEVTAVSLKGTGKDIIRLSREELMIVDLAKQVGRVSLQDVWQAIGGAKRTMQRRLRGLVEKGILKRYGGGRGVAYRLVKKMV